MCRLIFRPVGVTFEGTSGASDGRSLWIDGTVRSKIVDLFFFFGNQFYQTAGTNKVTSSSSSVPGRLFHVVSFSCLTKIQTWLRQVQNKQILHVL